MGFDFFSNGNTRSAPTDRDPTRRRGVASARRLRLLAPFLLVPAAATFLSPGGALRGAPAGHHFSRGLFPGPADSAKIGELPALPALNNHPEIRLREAFRAEIEGDNRVALEHYQAFFADGEDSAHARASYGRLLAVNRRYEDSLGQLDRAIVLAPHNSEYAILKAEVFRRAGQDDAALEFLTKNLHRYEDDAGVEFLLGELYFDRRDFSAAQAHHKRVLTYLTRADSRGVTYRSISLWRLADLNLQANRLERARDYLVQYLRHNPRRHYPRFILADRIYYRMGKFEDARRELETLLRSDPAELVEQSVDLARAYGLLARVYYLFEDVRFVETLRLSAAYSKNSEPGVVERALALAHRGDDREALQLLLPIVKRQEDTVFIPWVAILRIVSKSGRPGLYAEQLTHVAAIAEGFGRHRMALEWLQEAARIKAKHPESSVSETRINQVFAAHYEAMQQPYRAALYLDRAIRAVPDQLNPVADPQAAPAVRTGDAAQDADEFEEDPLDLIARLRLGRAAILGKPEIAQYDLALALCVAAGETALSYATRAEIATTRGDFPAAESAYDRAIALNQVEADEQQKDPRVREVLGIGRNMRSRYHLLRAAVRYNRENVAGAIQDLEAALELEPNFAVAANFLAYLYAGENDKLLTALRLIDDALETDPTNGHFIDTLAWIHYRRGEFAEARYHAQFAVRLLEDDENGDGAEPETLDHLGDILVALKRPADAERNYRRAKIVLEQRRTRAGARHFGTHEKKLLKKLTEKLLEPGTGS